MVLLVLIHFMISVYMHHIPEPRFRRRTLPLSPPGHLEKKTAKMKLLTLNFLTCAVKTCKSSSDSFPLHPKDAELASDDVDVNPELLVNLLPRLDWKALKTTSAELGFPQLPDSPPTIEQLQSDDKLLKDLHSLLMETNLMEGKLVCGVCGHEYAVREGIPNFLLPSHLV
ncbi:type I protein arginine N-methyltransferase Rmt1 [Podospora pseudoanserina]|uniref:Type I protein arginine N-methyltransferase Rmt1 n=1 Tax=Podospora pseudoanserina TaxID=2609844 RepID=A0ABR0IHR1_9PEZI|nr:type I protein arginine N-methyltransferase Rmt1 [Podospora pseudoanserina]